MSDSLRGERLQILLTQAELEALDTWRFAHRMPSRAAAIRELLKRGLSADGDSASGRSRSSDFRVVGGESAVDSAEGAPANPRRNKMD